MTEAGDTMYLGIWRQGYPSLYVLMYQDVYLGRLVWPVQSRRQRHACSTAGTAAGSLEGAELLVDLQ